MLFLAREKRKLFKLIAARRLGSRAADKEYYRLAILIAKLGFANCTKARCHGERRGILFIKRPCTRKITSSLYSLAKRAKAALTAPYKSLAIGAYLRLLLGQKVHSIKGKDYGARVMCLTVLITEHYLGVKAGTANRLTAIKRHKMAAAKIRGAALYSCI